MQLTQGLRRSADLFPDRAALIFGQRVKTWAEVEMRVARLAAALRDAGARPHDRIGIFASNSDHYIECYYAILWAGCIVVPFNTRWADAEVSLALDDSALTMMFVDSEFIAWKDRLVTRGLQLFGLTEGLGVPSVNELVSMHAPMTDASGSGDDVAGIFYTGGTTGRPKGVMLSHGNMTTNFLAFHAVAPFPQISVFLHTAPMFHLADACNIFGLSLVRGATHVVLPNFEPRRTIEAVEEYQITVLMLVPTMIAMLCEELQQRSGDMSSVLRVSYGASPISSTVLERAMRLLPNAHFVQAYGQTELSPIFTVLDHDDHVAGRLRAAGRVVPTMEIRIVDSEGQQVGPDKVGEIEARGPGVMRGYWNRPGLTAEAIVDGWLKTGDAGRLDVDGYLYLEDRVKDMIISGGENIYSGEVENAIMSHPAVVQCAVIGVPDPRWGERVHAIIQVRDRMVVTEHDLKLHCEPLIASYKRPKSFELRTTPLPLSGAGKIMKAELRKPFWAGQGRAIN